VADEREQTERISRALQTAESLTSDLKAAQATAGNSREEKLLLELHSDAQNIRDTLTRLAKAKGAE